MPTRHPGRNVHAEHAHAQSLDLAVKTTRRVPLSPGGQDRPVKLLQLDAGQHVARRDQANAAGPRTGADQRCRPRPQQELKVADRHDVSPSLQRDCLPTSLEPN
jgi:hypothetical protein